jgi:hypothetical protein
VQLHDVQSVPLAVVRRLVRASELKRVVPEGCGIVWKAIRAQGARAGRHVALYRDAAIHLEVGVELLGPFTDQGGVVRSATPAGWVASVTHFGPYDGLGAAHEAIRAWGRTATRQFAGPYWEVYDHWVADWDRDPTLIRTDVFYLVTEE